MSIKHKSDGVFIVKSLENIAQYDLRGDFEFSGEQHNFWELTYVDRGQIIINVKGNRYLLNAGEMVFYTPNEFHSIHLLDKKPATIIVVAFHCDSTDMQYFEKKILFLGAKEKQCLSVIVDEASKTFEHFDNIPPKISTKILDNPPFGGVQIIKNCLEQLFIYICRHGETIGIDRRIINDSDDGSSLDDQVKMYMQNRLADKLTLETIARHFSISPSQLNRRFKQHTGTSVISHLISMRILESKRLIREGKYNFTQIAEIVGYESIYYFSAIFKKHTGMTPSEYSRSVRE